MRSPLSSIGRLSSSSPPTRRARGASCASWAGRGSSIPTASCSRRTGARAGLATARVDLAEVRESRLTIDHLADRRPDAYGGRVARARRALPPPAPAAGSQHGARGHARAAGVVSSRHMCGIVAEHGGSDPDALERMLERLAHRGPDAHGRSRSTAAGSATGGCRSSTSRAARSRCGRPTTTRSWSATARSTTTRTCARGSRGATSSRPPTTRSRCI